MAVILTSRQFILPYLMLEVRYASTIYYFRHFGYLIDATAELLTKIWQLKLLFYFESSINDVMNSNFLIMKNVPILFINEYRGLPLRPPCDILDTVITMKNTFSGIIWDDLFMSEVRLKLFNISTLSKCPRL